MRDQIDRGFTIGIGKGVLSAAGSVLSLAEAYMVLLVDEITIGVDNTLIPGDWLTENTGAGARDERRDEAINTAIENIPNLPEDVKQYIADKRQEYHQAIADARFVEAGEIRGEIFTIFLDIATVGSLAAKGSAKAAKLTTNTGSRPSTQGSRVDGPEGSSGGSGVVDSLPNRIPVPNNLPSNIHMGSQGKHIPGHNNFDPTRNRSILNADANELLSGIHSGEYRIIRITGNKPLVDFGKPIGIHGKSGSQTQFGTIHYGKNGAHIVPADPIQY